MAVDAVEAGAPWAVPHIGISRLTEAATAQVLAGIDPDTLEPEALEEPPYRAHPGGGIVVIRRDVYEQVPLDPRFIGWGREDDSWGLALKTLIGRPVHLRGRLWHLWHPPQPRPTRTHGSDDNEALYQRYRAANHAPARMAALIEEVTSALTTYAAGITKELTGAANARGYLVAQPGASVLIKQDGVACDVYSDNEKTEMINPVPTGVAPGAAGVDTLGNLLVFLDPGRNYTATVTVGASVVTVPLPDVNLDAEEPIPAGAVEEAMLGFGVATQAELDAGLATKAPSSGIAQSAVSGLVSALAGKEPTIPPGTFVEGTTLTTNGDLLTRSAGAPARITRAALAADAAFTAAYVSTALLRVPGTNNAFGGADAGNLTVSGAANTGFGAGALALITSGQQNTALGQGALAAVTTGGTNNGFGRQALLSLQTGDDNVGIGWRALMVANGAADNQAVGSMSLSSLTGGYRNTAVGSYAGATVTTGYGNVFVGHQAGMGGGAGLEGGYENVMVGYLAGKAGVGMIQSVFIGASAGTATTTGSGNTFVGWTAGQANTTGVYNTALGHACLGQNTTGLSITALGRAALNAHTTGNYVVAVGHAAGFYDQTGTSNLYLGNTAGCREGAATATESNVSGSFGIYIGEYAGPTAGNLSNVTVIGNYAKASRANVVVIGGGTDTTGAVGTFVQAVGIGGSPDALTAAGELELVGTAKGYLAHSADGTLYRLVPPNGGGAATWVAA